MLFQKCEHGGSSVSAMLGNYRIVIDQWSEVYDLLRNHADEEFWRFADLEFDPDAITILGRVQLKENYYRVCDLAERYCLVLAARADIDQIVYMPLNPRNLAIQLTDQRPIRRAGPAQGPDG